MADQSSQAGGNVTNLSAYTGGSGTGGSSGGSSSGGGRGSGGMSGDFPSWKDYVDAGDEKTRAQNEARFAEVLSELRLIHGTSAGWKSVWAAAFTTIIAIAGLTYAAVSIGGDRWDGGFSAGGAVGAFIENQRIRDADQDARLEKVIDALEAAISQNGSDTPNGQN